jgi:hypothetical protein
MHRFIRRLSTLIAIFFVAGFGLVAHTSAMPSGGHGMGGMNHASGSSSVNCATLCANNTFYKDESVLAIREDEDDEPVAPYYVALRSVFIPTIDTDSRIYSDAVKPPPKVPIYIRLGVFRV